VNKINKRRYYFDSSSGNTIYEGSPEEIGEDISMEDGYERADENFNRFFKYMVGAKFWEIDEETPFMNFKFRYNYPKSSKGFFKKLMEVSENENRKHEFWVKMFGK
jgi:hypothetical protein